MLNGFAFILNSYYSTTLFRGRARKRRRKLPNFGKRKDIGDEQSSGNEEEEALEEDSANEADEEEERKLPIQSANGDEDKYDSDEDEAEIWKVANCPTHASQSYIFELSLS